MAHDLPAFTVGRQSGEYLSVTALYRTHNEAQDYWDGNWISSEIQLRVGAFSAKYQASFRVDEYQSFLSGLVLLYENLSGEAFFTSMEDCLTIEVRGNGHGHFEANCIARDEPGIGNSLRFSLAFDQTEIPAITTGLRAIVKAFPSRGSRDV